MTALDALTDRQREVALLVAEGLTDQCIADRLSLSRFTVRMHLQGIYMALRIRQEYGHAPRYRLCRLVWEASVAELVDAMLAEREAA